MYCQSNIELKDKCKVQCEHCKEYYKPLEKNNMKTILEKQDVIIKSEWTPKTYPKDLKDGDLIDHFNKVKECYFFHYIGEDMKLVRVDLDKEMILELAEKIKSLESEIEKFQYSSELPF